MYISRVQRCRKFARSCANLIVEYAIEQTSRPQQLIAPLTFSCIHCGKLLAQLSVLLRKFSEKVEEILHMCGADFNHVGLSGSMSCMHILRCRYKSKMDVKKIWWEHSRKQYCQLSLGRNRFVVLVRQHLTTEDLHKRLSFKSNKLVIDELWSFVFLMSVRATRLVVAWIEIE